MLNKNVCPKCGQLFDVGMEKCPLCGLPVQQPDVTEAPVQRRRITEAERRQRQQEQRRESLEARRRERDARRTADADAERRFEEAEARRREERLIGRLEKQGYTRAEAERRAARQAEGAGKGRKEDGGIPKNLLVLSIVITAIAIVIGTCYLIWRANGGGKKPAAQASEQSAGITLNTDEVELRHAGDTFTLSYALSSADTQASVSFESSDTNVADVGATGIITAKQPGEAKITVRCGAQEASCRVICAFEEEEEEQPTELVLPDGLLLSEVDITFFNPNENTTLHAVNAPNGVVVTWESDDESVAVVDAVGHVVAVGKGTCNIIAKVGNYSAACIVRCNFG